MVREYRYTVEGLGGRNVAEPFCVRGQLSCDLVDAYDLALGTSFYLLTGQGPVRPDKRHKIVKNCGGPYKVRRILIELEQ